MKSKILELIVELKESINELKEVLTIKKEDNPHHSPALERFRELQKKKKLH